MALASSSTMHPTGPDSSSQSALHYAPNNVADYDTLIVGLKLAKALHIRSKDGAIPMPTNELSKEFFGFEIHYLHYLPQDNNANADSLASNAIDCGGHWVPSDVPDRLLNDPSLNVYPIKRESPCWMDLIETL
ncbi:hypothetical protein QJS10_CPB22g00249 [Acorus calamus]|uniref:RNase H type-1 domain-containing protein n=1 Tax=Acorus calamus TaxID=4465 RepID=A0AAV9BZU1_ACOCL|nr:hypothetical protein QJS10_CPB22g00249 [Acorus calamus]